MKKLIILFLTVTMITITNTCGQVCSKSGLKGICENPGRHLGRIMK